MKSEHVLWFMILAIILVLFVGLVTHAFDGLFTSTNTVVIVATPTPVP